MARSVNKVTLIGNLGADPELRYTGSGTAVCDIRIATTDRWKDKNTGDWNERTEWHRLVAWGRLAEICGEYLKKGARAYFEGSLQTRSWEDKDGHTRYTTEIKVSELMMLDGRRDDSQGGGGSYNQNRSQGGGGNNNSNNQNRSQGGGNANSSSGNNGGNNQNKSGGSQQKTQAQGQASGGNNYNSNDFSTDANDDLPF